MLLKITPNQFSYADSAFLRKLTTFPTKPILTTHGEKLDQNSISTNEKTILSDNEENTNNIEPLEFSSNNWQLMQRTLPVKQSKELEDDKIEEI